MSGFKVFLFSGRLGTTLLLYIQAIAVRRTELSTVMILPSGLAEGSLLLFLYVHVYTIYYS